MAYQPTYPSPYNDVIDADSVNGVRFKCLINPKDVIISAICYVYINDTNELVNTFDLPSSLFPFYGSLSDDSWLEWELIDTVLYNGIDYKWAVELKFQERQGFATGKIEDISGLKVTLDCSKSVTLSVAEAITKNIPCFIKVENEIRQISKAYYRTNGNAEFYVTSAFSSAEEGTFYEMYGDETTLLSPEYFFKARTYPSIDFTVPSIVTSSSYILNPTYSQAENSRISYYKYDLYSEGVLILSTKQYYSYSMKYVIDNLISGRNYSIILTVVTSDGLLIEEERYFYVEYNIATSSILPLVTTVPQSPFIGIDFSNQAEIIGNSTPSNSTQQYTLGEHTYKSVTTGNILYIEDNVVQILFRKYIKPNMFIKVSDEIRTIEAVDYSDDVIVLTIDESFSENVTIGSSYEILSTFNGIHLNNKAFITWDTVGQKQLSIPNNSSQVIHWHGEYGFIGDIFEGIDENSSVGNFKVSFTGEKFVCKIGSIYLKEFAIYKGTASAIAGNDEFSIIDTIQNYSSDDKTITLHNNSFIESGKCVQIDGEHRLITDVSIDEDNEDLIIVTLDDFFTFQVSASTECVVYDENYRYRLSDEDKIADNDILVDNDLLSNYWWLIVVLPNEVRVIKTTRFTRSDISGI